MKEMAKKRKKKKTYLGTFFSVFFKALLVVILLGLIAAGVMGFNLYNKYYKVFDKEAKEIVENGSSNDFKKNEPTYFYDKDGNVIAKLRGDGDSTYLTYDGIPENAINAFIAVEDRTFWKNPGYDTQGIIRVVVRYLKTHGVEQHGASTITQQLARNVYLSQEVSMRRKIKEILISKYLTKKYTKKEIMEYYVNDVYFANQYYGLEAAAQGYFGKKASQLSLSETAYLCSIPNRPAYYDPIKYPDNALKRRDKILSDMLEEKMISQTDYDVAVSEKINLKEQTNTELNDYQATFAMDCAVRYLMGLDGFEFRYKFDSNEDYKNYKTLYDESYEEEKSTLYSNGYKIYTTLDSDAQKLLQKALDENLSFDDEINSSTGAYAFQGAVTAIDNVNGKVIALVGGRTDPSGSSSTYTLNRAYQSYRQPGSSIKPVVVYTPGLEIGYAPGSILENINVSSVKKMTALQAICQVGDPMTLRTAVEKSQNGCAWSVYANISPKTGLQHIVDMEYQNIVPDDYTLATALGGFTNGVTTVEQAAAYAALANHGTYRGQTCLASLKDNDGNELYVESESKEVYKPEAADTMIDIMKGVIKKGTASKMGWYDVSSTEAAGKTGTTNGSKDGWFCGVTPYYSVAVWVGYDSPRELANLYGSSYPAAIWKDAMSSLISGYEAKEFSLPNKMPETPSGDKYLPGREDTEELVSGYTVANYRADRETGEAIRAVNGQMTSVSPLTDPNAPATVAALYQQCQGALATIKDLNYMAKLINETNAAYATAVSQTGVVVQTPAPDTGTGIVQ